MVEIQDGGYSSGLYKKCCAPHMFGYHLYKHNTKKGRGSICPIHLVAPICLDAPYVWMAPVSLDAPICLPVCLDTPICLGAHLCLDAPVCLDTSHMFRWPLYIHNTKKACFVRLKGCAYAPIHLDAPICLDDPLYVWMHPLYV